MKKQNRFPLFQSHLDLAHSYWDRIVHPGDSVIDATCGNGHDTLYLAQLAFPGELIAIDIQAKAIEATRERLSNHLEPQHLNQIRFLNQCHSSFPNIPEGGIKLIVYNLGYLPGGDKQKTTMCDTTIASLEAAMKIICPGGAISVTCYPGHPEGKLEEKRVLDFCSSLDALNWNCCYHCWTNRLAAPSLMIIQKKV